MYIRKLIQLKEKKIWLSQLIQSIFNPVKYNVKTTKYADSHFENLEPSNACHYLKTIKRIIAYQNRYWWSTDLLIDNRQSIATSQL